MQVPRKGRRGVADGAARVGAHRQSGDYRRTGRSRRDAASAIPPEELTAGIIPARGALGDSAQPVGATRFGTRAVRGTLWLAGGAWTSKGAQTVLLVVVARLLGAKDLGILAVASVAINVLTSIQDLGVSEALAARKDRVHEAARTATTMVVAVGLVLCVAGWLSAPALAAFFHQPGATWLLRGFDSAIVFDAVAAVPVAMLTRELDFRRRLVTDALPALVGNALSLVLVVTGLGLLGFLVGQLTWQFGRMCCALVVGHPTWPGWDRAVFREMVHFGLPLGASSLVMLILLNVDYMIVGRLLGVETLGLYSLAFRICYVPFLCVPFIVNGVAFSYYCRLGSRPDVVLAVRRVLLFIMAGVVPLCVCLALFPGEVQLLGHRWAPAAPVIRWLAVYAAGLSVGQSCLVALAALGRTRLVLAGNLIQLGSLTGLILATVRHGIAVVGFDQAVVAWGVAALALGWLAHEAVSWNDIARALGPPTLAGATMAGVVTVMRILPGLDRVPAWPPLLVLASVGLAVYLTVLACLVPSELRLSWAALRNRVSGPQDAAHRGRSDRLGLPRESCVPVSERSVVTSARECRQER